ncbi:MAG: peptide chain release factor N(5)-glutamine methyltransferase [Nitrospirota bacterium]|nr:peptide chain release factor N(5)-glutamine methyltransferase [Nitrospirota bacterium]
METPVRAGAALSEAVARLAAVGVEEPRHDAERLLARVLGVGRLALLTDPERPLAAAGQAAFEAMIARRAAREPLQYILGDQPFRTLELCVTPATLIPRGETEEVVERALRALGDLRGRGITRPQVLDLGAGSGCMALSIVAEWPTARVTGVDVCGEALAVARQNAATAGVAGRVRLLEGDLYAPLQTGERFHLIVSNPPYLTPEEWQLAAPEVRDFEPRRALLGGEDGLEFYRRIFAGAPRHLLPGGIVVVEIGWTQGQAVADIARRAGFRTVAVESDLGGRERMVVATGPDRED